jgi:WD40 repeat protein
VSTGEVIWTLTGHSDRVYTLAFSPDGKILATGSWDKTVKLWKLH